MTHMLQHGLQKHAAASYVVRHVAQMRPVMLSMEGERVRRVINRAVVGTKGRFPSLKSGRVIHWESQLERDFVRCLEFDTDVISFREQPLTTTFPFEGKQVRYTPDFLVERKGGMWIYEVKPADKALKLADSGFITAAEAAIADLGARFCVVTEQTIRRQPRLANVEILLRYQQVDLDETMVLEARSVVAVAPITIGLLAGLMKGSSLGLPEIYAMVRWGLLGADIDSRSLGAETPLSVHERR